MGARHIEDGIVERRADRRQASLRRLERKVDTLTERIDLLNLNGSAATLKRLAEQSDHLLELASVAPTIVAAVERDADMAAFWRVMRRYLNPLRPVGAFIWLLATTIVSATVWNVITLGRLHIP